MNPSDEWLRSPDGREWLESDKGRDWLLTDGVAWSESREGRLWFDELAQRGFADYFAGKMIPPPDWAIMPDAAPQIGARVRLVKDETTAGGVSFEGGELMIVDELRLMPMGAVWVSLRTVDGRKFLTGMASTFEPA